MTGKRAFQWGAFAQLTNRFHNAEDVTLCFRWRPVGLLDFQRLFSSSAGPTVSGVSLSTRTAGALGLNVTNGSGVDALSVTSSAGVLTDGKWHDFAYRKIGAAVELQVDGALVISGTINSPSSADAHFKIEPGYPNSTAIGHYAEWAAFDVALTDAELAHWRAEARRWDY
jgi:hypothetical protein